PRPGGPPPLQGPKDRIPQIPAWWTHQLAEGIRLHAEPNSGHSLGMRERRERQTPDRKRAEFSSRQHDLRVLRANTKLTSTSDRRRRRARAADRQRDTS